MKCSLMEVFGGREKNRASCDQYRTFPARSSDPHRSYHGRTDEFHSWTGPGSTRDSITWTNRVPPSNYSVGQKMEERSERKEKQRNGGNLVNEWQPEHNRREQGGVGSTRSQELEAWASRYYHSLPRRKQNIGEKSGFAGRSIPEDPRLQHGFWKSKPPPPYMPVKPLSPERTKILRPCFSHTPNYTPPPPYSSSRNTKEPDGTPVRGLTKVMMEPRFGRRPDHCNRTLKFSQTKSGDRALHSSRKYPDTYKTIQEPSTTVPPKPSENIRSASSAPAQQSKPRRGFGGTVFCLVSHSEVSNPPNKAPQNHEKGKIQKVQLENQNSGSLTSNKKDLQASLVACLTQDQTTKFPSRKEPTLLHCSKGLEKTPEQNQDQNEQVSSANQNKGLVAIDATCVMVKAKLLIPSEQKLIQYVYKVQKNNSNSEESTDRRSKHEKATQTSSLKVPENETPKVRAGRIRTVNWVPCNSKHLQPSQTENTGKVPKIQSSGCPENKESEGQLKKKATSEKSLIPNLTKSKVKESQSLVVKARRTSEGHGILVMKSSEEQLDGSFEGRMKESPSDKIDMKNQCRANLTSVVNPGEIFGQNTGSVQETDSIQNFSSMPFEICMENKKPFNQGHHPIDGGISDVNNHFFGYHEGSDSRDDLKAERGGIQNPNPTILDNQMVTTYQTSDQDVSASQSQSADDIQCSAQLDQQDRVHGSKPSNLHPDFDRDHPKITCETFGQEGHSKHLQSKTTVHGPRPVLKKLSEMFEHNRKRLCSPMAEVQISKGDLLHSADQNLESSCEVFDQEPSNSTDDVTKASPSLFEDQMESKRSQEGNRSEISFQDKMEDQEGCSIRSNLKPDANNLCHGNHMESTSDGSHGEGNLKTGAVDDVYPNLLLENLKDTSKPFDQESSFYVENKSTSLYQEGSNEVKKPAGIRNIGPNCLWDYVEELHEGSSVDNQPDKTTEIKNISTFLLNRVEPPDAQESSVEVNQPCGDKNIYSTLLHKHVDHLEPQQSCTWTANFSDDISSLCSIHLIGSENPTEQISQDGTSDLQTLQHVDDPDSVVPPSFSGTDCNRPDCGTCLALSNAAQSGSQGSSRSIKPKPRSIWDAVSRIRRHTAPDSESEEEEQSDDLWDSPDDEVVNLDGAMELEAGEPVLEMKLQDVIKGSDGDADVPPEESDDSRSSCSLESRGSNGTVIERLDVVERDGDGGGSDEGDNMNIKAESEFRRQSTS